MSPQLLTVNGVDLCAETFGDHGHPALLLIGGAGSSMDFWEVDFCEELAAAGRFVIRYDLRDTGRSVSYPPGRPAYTSHDLIDDALGLLDALDVRTANMVGISMGGAIAQLLSILQPERVATLTLLSTTAIGSVDDDLPGPSPALVKHFADPLPEPDWEELAAVVDYLAEDLRAYAGTSPVDDDALRAHIRTVVLRTNNIESAVKNHSMLPDDDPVLGGLQASAVRAPTLVMHGSADPLFPFAHGEALTRAIPNARLIVLDGVGHEVPPRAVWPMVVPELIRHTEAIGD